MFLTEKLNILSNFSWISRYTNKLLASSVSARSPSPKAKKRHHKRALKLAKTSNCNLHKNDITINNPNEKINCSHNLTTIVGAQRIQNAATEKCMQACAHDKSHILLSAKCKYIVIHLEIFLILRQLEKIQNLYSFLRQMPILTDSSYNSLKLACTYYIK